MNRDQRAARFLIVALVVGLLLAITGCQNQDVTPFTNASGSTSGSYTGAGVCAKALSDLQCWRDHTGPSNGDTAAEIRSGVTTGNNALGHPRFTYHHLIGRVDMATYPTSGGATATLTYGCDFNDPLSAGWTGPGCTTRALTSSDGFNSSDGSLTKVWLEGCVQFHASAMQLTESLVDAGNGNGCGSTMSDTNNAAVSFDDPLVASAHSYGSYSNVTLTTSWVDSTEIVGGDRIDGISGVGSANFIAGHVEIGGFSKGLWTGKNATVKDSAIWHMTSNTHCYEDVSTPTPHRVDLGSWNYATYASCAAQYPGHTIADTGPHQDGIFANGGQGSSGNHIVIQHNFINMDGQATTAGIFQGSWQGSTTSGSLYQDVIDNFIRGHNGLNIHVGCYDRGMTYEANVLSDDNSINYAWNGVGGGVNGIDGSPSPSAVSNGGQNSTAPNRWYSSGLDNQSPRQDVIRGGVAVPKDPSYTWNLSDGVNTNPTGAGWQDIPNNWGDCPA